MAGRGLGEAPFRSYNPDSLPTLPIFFLCRSDSSFNFFVFFFIFFVQDVLFVLQAIGIPGWGFRSVRLPFTLTPSSHSF